MTEICSMASMAKKKWEELVNEPRYAKAHYTPSEWGKAIGDRDSDVEQSQRTPSLHYTGYLVQTVCQLSVGRALPCWGLSGWTGAQPPRVREVTTPRTVVYRREQMI